MQPGQPDRSPCSSNPSSNLRSLIPEVLRLALPVAAQALLQTLVFFVDRLMLGRYSADALASMHISSPLLWTVSAILTSFSVGTLAFVGRMMGRRDRAIATAAMRGSLVLASGLGLVTSVAFLAGLSPFLSLVLSNIPGVRIAAQEYLQIVMVGLSLLMVTIVATAGLQGAGDTRTPFLIGIVANGANIGLNSVLIFGHLGFPELGVRGAGIATLIATVINASALVGVLMHPKAVLSLRGRGQERHALSRILRISGPALGERIFEHLGYWCYASMIVALGGMAMATHQIVLGLESICFLSGEGFGVAGAAIVAQRLGADRPQDAARCAWITVGLSVGFLSTLGLVFLSLPQTLLSLFTIDDAIVTMGVPCLYIAAVAQPFMALSMVLGDSLRGAGDTRTAFVISLSGWLVVRSIMTYLFAFVLDLGLVGVWLGSTSDWIIRSIVLSVIFLQNKWQRISI